MATAESQGGAIFDVSTCPEVPDGCLATLDQASFLMLGKTLFLPPSVHVGAGDQQRYERRIPDFKAELKRTKQIAGVLANGFKRVRMYDEVLKGFHQGQISLGNEDDAVFAAALKSGREKFEDQRGEDFYSQAKSLTQDITTLELPLWVLMAPNDIGDGQYRAHRIAKLAGIEVVEFKETLKPREVVMDGRGVQGVVPIGYSNERLLIQTR